MAIRTVREVGDDVLTKQCREVKKMTPRIQQLIDDMFDTMYASNGVGLAAPQVGVLRRIIVLDVGEDPRVLINPVLVSSEGSQTGDEGCLSLPGKFGTVTRPMKVTVEGLDRDMQPVSWEAEGLLARCFCHEIDHLDGHMYTELVEGDLHDAAAEEEMAES
ncbi:MAG: peptide deformylase [Lachnospiraceae bacterium]|nr:peptide deformylase [Lachnospiraceae bacterium]